MQIRTAETRVLPLSKINPVAYNPRKQLKPGDPEWESLARSMAEFGNVGTLVWNERTGNLVGGHQRLAVLLHHGETEAPVSVVDLDGAKERALNIALNKISGEWDNAKLAEVLQGLMQGGTDIALTGFDVPDASRLIGEMLATPTMGKTQSDDVPEPPATTVTCRGDMWILGNHRLLCGDSTNRRDVERVMDGHRAALVATDPPYLVDYTGERGDGVGKDWSATYREIDITDADSFFRGVFGNVAHVLEKNAAIYCWHAHKRQALISKIWDELGILDHQQVIWVKPTPVFGRVFWHFRHEPCMMGWVKGSMPAHDSDHQFNSVWEIDWEGKSRVVGNEHPTQKPVEIFARPMRKHTKPGDICFEPFSGSGSQLIAAEREGRRCFAIEIQPVFVEVAVRRWEAFTGRKAERVPALSECNEKAPAVAGAGCGPG